MGRSTPQDCRRKNREGHHAVTPFVLTGTIVPNAVPTIHNDVHHRRDEYERAIRFYLGFGPVYFIENSDYPVFEDSFFTSTPALKTIQYPKSLLAVRGKGYQEFEMLDAFVSRHLREELFIKVTGRYLYKNISDMVPRMVSQLSRGGIVIDLMFREKKAIVSLFGASKSFYILNMMGAYRDMDDPSGLWAEFVLYRRIKQTHASTFLRPNPVLHAVMGSTGQTIEMPHKGFKSWLKNRERQLFSAAGVRELLF